jgi:hypothetical protein
MSKAGALAPFGDFGAFGDFGFGFGFSWAFGADKGAIDAPGLGLGFNLSFFGGLVFIITPPLLRPPNGFELCFSGFGLAALSLKGHVAFVTPSAPHIEHPIYSYTMLKIHCV